MANNINVFEGKDSIKDYLNPGKLSYLPLVEIPKALNPFYGDGVRVFAKVMTFIGMHNVKAVPAYNMMAEHEKRGELEGVSNLIENSSGNTISALAAAARQFGIERIHAFVPTEISWHKLLLLLFFGISPIVNQEPDFPNPNDASSGINKAKELGKQEGWINPGQYTNEDNPLAHQKWIGNQIWEQTKGQIKVLAAGLGTTGTIIGNSKYLKDKDNNIQVIGVMRAPDNYVPGPRTELLLKLIGFDWQKHVDNIQEAETSEAYQKSMELSRIGLLVGPSSGLSLVGLLKYLKERKNNNTLDALRGEKEEIVCTFICPDTSIPYVDEYFKYLDASNFPKIEHEELLLNKPES